MSNRPIITGIEIHEFEYELENMGTGFRVASVPEPGSILVWLGVGVVGLIWFRRRK